VKITGKQFQLYLTAAPPVIWMWIYGELKDGEAKSEFYKFAFDEVGLRDLTRPWMHMEFLELVSKFPEIEIVARQAATNYYIRHSWRKWLPWNWQK